MRELAQVRSRQSSAEAKHKRFHKRTRSFLLDKEAEERRTESRQTDPVDENAKLDRGRVKFTGFGGLGHELKQRADLVRVHAKRKRPASCLFYHQLYRIAVV
jgi:hypothetical protein